MLWEIEAFIIISIIVIIIIDIIFDWCDLFSRHDV